jgi:hypothetical protein
LDFRAWSQKKSGGKGQALAAARAVVHHCGLLAPLPTDAKWRGLDGAPGSRIGEIASAAHRPGPLLLFALIAQHKGRLQRFSEGNLRFSIAGTNGLAGWGCAAASQVTLQQSNVSAVPVLPGVRERIVPAQLVAGCEKKQRRAGAVRNAELAQGFLHRLRAASVSRDREHAKCLPSELAFVLFGGVGGEVRAHFLFEAGPSNSRRLALAISWKNGE